MLNEIDIMLLAKRSGGGGGDSEIKDYVCTVTAENGAIVFESNDGYELVQSDVAIDSDDYMYWTDSSKRLIISQPDYHGIVVDRIFESRINFVDNRNSSWISFGGSNSSSGIKCICNDSLLFYVQGDAYRKSLSISLGMHDVKLVSNNANGDTWYVDGVEVYHHDSPDVFSDRRYTYFVQYLGDICVGQNQSSYSEMCTNKIHSFKITTRVYS